MSTEYTELFTVIIDKKPRFPRFFVQHEITSKLTISALKYGDNNIMTILQPLRVWMAFNKLSIHREASIGFLKCVSTGLTLHSTAKNA